MVIVCYSIMMWKKDYEQLYIFFLQYKQFFTDWNTMVLLNINRNYSSCPGTTHMSLIVGDWICSLIIKIMMEPDPWTLLTYSANVLISWTQAKGHSLYGMWCNSKPLSMICLVFTQASSVLNHLFRAVGRHYWRPFSLCSESTCLHMAPASSLLAPLHWKSLWSKRDGGSEHSS